MKRERLKKPLLVFFSGSVLLGVLLLTGVVSIGDERVQTISRDTYNAAAKKESLLVKTESGKEIPMEIEVQERIYSDRQVQEFIEEARERIPKEILGENKSLDRVWTDLNFMEQLKDNPVAIAWETSNGEYLTPFGERTEQRLEEEVLGMEITATLTLQETEERFTIPIQLTNKETGKEEAFYDRIVQEVEKVQDESRTSADFELPKEVDGVSLTWFRKNSTSVGGLFFLILLAAGLVYWKEEKENEKKRKERKEQMQLDYPDIVSKLTLLLGAGISLQRAWERMVKEYLLKRQNRKIKKHFAYEEMAFACREMENGVSLQTALNHFGNRCDLPVYSKFSTLLAQNLRRGNKGLVESLQRESEEAFEERKAMAKMLGEKASTKLLVPMFLMLLMVLVVIMVPAFLSFSI